MGFRGLSKMASNLGRTTLKGRRHTGDKMRDFDRLPVELRRWMAEAKLPWRAGSVKTAYDKALGRTGDPVLALRELDRVQAGLVKRDAQRIWGRDHPEAAF